MKSLVAVAAVAAVAVLTLLATWRALRAFGVLQRANDRLEQEPDLQRTQLLDEKMRHLRGLKEVEFDHATGKIDDADYASLRQRHEVAAAEAMRALDALPTSEPGEQP